MELFGLPTRSVISEVEEHRRIMIITIFDGEIKALPIIHQLEMHRRREEIYRWLINNKVIGKKFFHFAAERKCSWIQIARDVLARIDGEKKQVIAGKDTF